MTEYIPLKDGIFSPNTVDYESLMRRRIKKASSHLQPIYEAFSNALEATEGKDNCITIELNHIKSHNIFGEDYSYGSLSIIDDGSGFTDESFSRMERLYDESKNKNNLGSGRVQYLHFFKTTQIESIYQSNGIFKRRNIEFSKDFYDKHKSVIRSTVSIYEESPVKQNTRVTFFFPIDKEDSEKYAKLSCQEIKDAILKRYIYIFCMNRDNLQKICINHYINGVLDTETSSSITAEDIPTEDYNDKINVHYSALSTKGDSTVRCAKTEEFILSSYKLPSNILAKNEVRLTSKGESFPHQGFDFSLITETPRIEQGFSLLFLISSNYLTSIDPDVRGTLNLVTKSDFIAKRNLFTGQQEILIDDIEQESIASISAHYPALQKAKKKADDNLKKVAELFSIDKDLMEKAGVRCSDSDVSVLKKVYNFSADVKAESDAKIKRIVDSLHELDPNDKDFEKKFSRKVSELNSTLPLSVKDELSNYLSRRALVLKLMEEAVRGNLDAQRKHLITKGNKKRKRQSEGIFHNLLFPKGSADPIESNLWILNEEYIHFQGISESELDKVTIDGIPLFKQELTQEEKDYKLRTTGDIGGKRPDVLLFPQEGKCIIVEFKAPGVDVSKHIHQIQQYASFIHHLSDERFKFNSYYGYLIGENADVYSILDSDGDFQESQNLGFLVRPHKNLPRLFGRAQGVLYTEIIKFSDLLKRANLRNKIFTDKILSNNNSIENSNGASYSYDIMKPGS